MKQEVFDFAKRGCQWTEMRRALGNKRWAPAPACGLPGRWEVRGLLSERGEGWALCAMHVNDAVLMLPSGTLIMGDLYESAPVYEGTGG